MYIPSLLNSNTVHPAYIGLFRVSSSFFSWNATNLLPKMSWLMYVGLEAYL